MSEDSQNTSIPNGMLLQIANNILDLLEYNSELNEEDDLFSDQFYIIIVGHLVTDEKFDIKPGETQEEQVDALDRLISFLGHIIDKDLSIISAEGIITEHDRVSTKLLLELIEELIKALKNENENENEENEEEQSDERGEGYKISKEDELTEGREPGGRIVRRKEESNESMSVVDPSGNVSIDQRANISDRAMTKKRHNMMMHDDEDEIESIELPGDKAKRKQLEKEAILKQKQKEKEQMQLHSDSSLKQSSNDNEPLQSENEKIQTEDMHANYTEENKYTTSNNNDNYTDDNKYHSPQSLKDIETSNEIQPSSNNKPYNLHSNSDEIPSKEEKLHRQHHSDDDVNESNNSLGINFQNRSCFEALEYEKMVKIGNGEYDDSLIRKTLTENDLSRFERVLIENGEDEEQESEQHDHNYPIGIDYEDGEHDPQNDTPVMNVSHISEVSKSKENSEHQGKLNSKSRKNESVDRKKEAIVIAKQKEQQMKANAKQDKDKEQIKNKGREQDESNELPSLSHNDNNNQSHPSSYYINNKKDDSRDIDYNQDISDSYDQDQEDYRNMTGGHSIHSVPQAHTKMKLNSSSNNSSSYKQPHNNNNKKSPFQSSLERNNSNSNSNNSQTSHKKSFNNKNTAGNNSISNKPNTINNNSNKPSITNKGVSNKANNNNDNKNSNNSKDNSIKNQNRHSQSDISQSSLYSQSSQNRIAKSKSEHDNILEEIPLSDEVLKFEIIKEFKKLYGNKLDKMLLQNNLQNSHDILQIILRNIKLARQKMISNNQQDQSTSHQDDQITKEFIHKYQKELQYIIEYYHKEKNKRNKFQEKALNTLSKNVRLMKKTQEIQTKKMEAEIERKKELRDAHNQQQQVRICNEIYSRALQLEKEKYLEEISNHMILRRKENDDKRRGMMEVEKYYTDKIAILKEILRREKKERNLEYRAKEQILERLGKERKGEFKKKIEEVFDKFDEEEKKEDLNDNNQEEIEKILTNYYKK